MAWHRQPYFDDLQNALSGRARFHIMVGPRGGGKSTLAAQVLARWPGPKRLAQADLPYPLPLEWVTQEWGKLQGPGTSRALLVLDEPQRIPGWGEKVLSHLEASPGTKVLALWSTWAPAQRPPEGSYSRQYIPHWDYKECFQRYGFRMSMGDYFLMGGYPGALVDREKEVTRWGSYLRDAILEPVLGKDLLSMFPVQKHELLRKAFGLACAHAGEVVSYYQLAQELPDAGNAVTLARYFEGLKDAFLLVPLPRWHGNEERENSSAPKLVIRDNGLITALLFPTLEGVDDQWKKKLLKNAVLAGLLRLADEEGWEPFYWKDRALEVDLVLAKGDRVLAFQVVEDPRKEYSLGGLLAFKRRHPKAELTLMGDRREIPGVRFKPFLAFFREPVSVLVYGNQEIRS
jgi:hypothetical protein